MATRYFDRILKCGCMISSDGGGGLIPCDYGCGCGKKMDALGVVKCGDEIRENSIPQGEYFICKECRKQHKLCAETWKKWRKSKDYKKHLREVKERNE